MFVQPITTAQNPLQQPVAAYAVTPVPLDRTVRVRLAGFFGKDDVAGFAASYAGALAELQLAPNQHNTLCDITQMAIQAQDIVAAFASFMSDPKVHSRKLAFVISSSLSRMQAQRLTDRDTVKFFMDPAEAEAWLKA